MARLQLIATLIGTAAVLVSGQVDSGMRSFSSAIKAGTIAAYTEKVLYEYESKLSGVITEQWFAGKRMHSLRQIANPDFSCNKNSWLMGCLVSAGPRYLEPHVRLLYMNELVSPASF